MAEHRTFSDEDRAQAIATLRANGGNEKKTARQLGIGRSTLRGWSGSLPATETRRPPVVVVAAVAEATQGLAEKFLQAANALVSAALDQPEKIEKAGVKDLLIAAGIATEKHQLLVGAPTQRSEVLKVSLIAPDTLRSGTLKVIEGKITRS